MYPYWELETTEMLPIATRQFTQPGYNRITQRDIAKYYIRYYRAWNSQREPWDYNGFW